MVLLQNASIDAFVGLTCAGRTFHKSGKPEKTFRVMLGEDIRSAVDINNNIKKLSVYFWFFPCVRPVMDLQML